MTNDLYKERSAQACIHDAYEMMCNNAATIFRRTWLPVAVAAVLLGIITSAMLSASLSTQPSFALISILVVATIVAHVACGAWIDTHFLRLLTERTASFPTYKRQAILRSISAAIAVVAAIIVLVVDISAFRCMFQAKASVTNTMLVTYASMGIAMLILAFASVPFFYGYMKCSFDLTSKPLKIFTSFYRQGLRRYSILFAALALSGLISAIILCIAAIPLSVMTGAQIANFTGMLLGDASALPSCSFAFTAIAAAAASFVGLYVGLWVYVVMGYAHGSIEWTLQQKQEKSTEQ